jgi:cation diffusion facilitator CzcD-associated flavoprotein CzcO
MSATASTAADASSARRPEHSPDAIIIGAGPSGLAVAACLKEAGLTSLILDRADAVATSWRHHYERLHLHTDRSHSALPGMAMPRDYPRYPARLQVIDYLERYARHFELTPCFGVDVRSAERAGPNWRVTDERGTIATAPVLVVATGAMERPRLPDWPGSATFGGEIRHTANYARAASYAGRRVLVVGLGNSGGEIALDLAEHGIDVTLSVRGPVSVIPRDLLGLPILTWAVLLDKLPARLADLASWPLIRLSIGSLRRLGLTPTEDGPFTTIYRRGRIPLIDFGTIAAIRKGRIKVRPDIAALEGDKVAFIDGRREPFDAIIAATGFTRDLRKLLPDAGNALDGTGSPRVSGRPTGVPGLYFCGFRPVPTGQLREIGREARRIARHVAADRRTG